MVILSASLAPIFADAPHVQVVRVVNKTLDDDLRVGIERSSTMRRLARRLDRSDLIIHVLGGVPRLDRPRSAAGSMRFVGAHGGRRYLRITVDEGLDADTRVAELAHELQHALEVAQAPDVVDQASFLALYRHIGVPSCGGNPATCFETPAARQVGISVITEMRRAALLMAR